jgi:hypothetical protein
MQSLLQTSSRIASRSTGTHQSCRKSRMSRGSMRVYVAGNGTLPVDLNRSSICTVRSFLLVPTLPLFFLGVTSQSTVCAKMYLIGVCSTMQHSCTDAPRHPQTTFLSFHIWSTPSPCVAREIRCAGGRRKEAQARARIQTHPSGVPVAETFIHSLSVISSLNFRMIQLTLTTDLNL